MWHFPSKSTTRLCGPLRGYELPERHGIVFRGPVLKLADKGLERMYVSVTNYDDRLPE